jgi:integrase
VRLSKETVNRLELPEGKSELLVFDDQLRGFGIRLRAGGKRSWIVQYRVGQKQRRVTIGSAAALDLEAARREAKQKLAQVALGSDPQLEKWQTKKQATETLGVLIARYLESYAARSLAPRTLVEVTRSLKSHWKRLHELPVAKIVRRDIAAELATIAQESGPFAANRARAYLSSVFGWAVMQGLAEGNPVSGTGRVTPEVSRDRVLKDDELALVWRHAGEGDYGTIIRLLILTGQRREEVAAMRWSELYLATGTWEIPATRTKNGRPHIVPLSHAAIDTLNGVERRKGRDLVFGSGTGPFSGWSKGKSKLDDRILLAKRQEDPQAKPLPAWRIHDLRRTAATRMADLGVQPHVVEAVLNHISGHRAGIAGIYNRAAYGTEKKTALTLWADHINDIFKRTA